ncbi:MAG TPA: response regulator transcription factor [Chitinophagales bacterium]|nr:response regulator transcription factor [Chitinophagales bacterium]
MSKQVPINIVIADRDFLIKTGLKCLLSKRNDFEITGEANNIAELKDILRLHQPDVLIMDYDQPGAFSIDDLVFITRKYPAIKILVISNNRHKHDIVSTVEFGITSYLLKECGEDEIFDALYATARGQKFFCSQIVENILGRVPAPCQGLTLTERELEIVKLVAEGYTTAEISRMLSRSIHTINTHRKNILNKLGLNNPSELVLYAVKRRLIAA